MIIQIYEIQTPDEAEKCIELGVDHVGSVLLGPDRWKDSGIKQVINIVAESTAKTSIIPLFNDFLLICRCMEYYSPDFVHLCDALTDDKGNILDLDPFVKLQKKLKIHFPEIKIMRSIPISRYGHEIQVPTLEIARAMEGVTDIFLTDTWLGQEPVKGFIGITGQVPDWNVAAKLVKQCSIPVILAGGLSPENVYEALLKVKPAGADSCTGTNMTDKGGKPIRFKKDFTKVERFVKEVRRASKILGK